MSFSAFLRSLTAAVLLVFPLFASDQKPSAKEGWLEINTTHFLVTTDAGEKRGREVARRLEQMRAVFGNLLMRDKIRIPEPLQVLALKSDKDYERISPMPNNVAITAPAFFLSGEDKNFIVLTTFGEEPWRAIAHPFAHVLLNGNYPPAQSWFDEGFAEYFASIRLDNKTIEMGGDPELNSKYSEDLLGNTREARNPPRSLTELLSGPLWLKMTDLFSMHLPPPEGTHRTLFYAQSWMVMHYLLSKQMLGQVGTYFDLVQNQRVPVDRAITQAFGMTPEQFEQAVKDYFKTLTPLFLAQDQANLPDTRNNGAQTGQFPAPLGPDDVAMVVNKLSDDDGHAIVAEVMARQPEHRAQGLKDLESLAQEPADNEIAHRALAYIHILKKEFQPAADEIAACLAINPKDRWPRYYNALLKFRIAQTTGQPIEGGLANVQQGLRQVIDWYPDFAEAYHMLGLSEMQGGGINASLDSLREAIKLSPRNEWYVMNLADAYLAGKKWQNGQDILEHLKTSDNPQIAAMAKKKLGDLPFLKRYGMYPEAAAEVKAQETEEAKTETKAEESDSGEGGEPKLKQRAPDKRPIQYMKGKIVNVDCSQAPAAVVTIASAGRMIKLHTGDYKSVALVGTNDFSCQWRNQPAAVNYKATTKTEGDLVSVEVQ